MAFVKYTKGEIINIVKASDKDIDEKKVKKSMEEVKQAAKNIDKDGNIESCNKE